MIGIIQKLKENVSCNLHMHKIFDLLVQNHDFKFVDINFLNENKENLEKYFIDNFDEVPKFIIIYYGLTIINPIKEILKKLNIKIILFIDDIHHSLRVSKPRNEILRYTSYVFATYGYQINRWNLINVDNTFYFPHSALDIIPFNNKPINKILISGTLHKDFYPDRDFICQFKESTIILKKECGYRNNKVGIVGINYYKKLNEYICCFCDISNRDYTLAKIFEILASGSLLLCSNEPVINIFENDLGLIDNVHYISCSQKNMKEKIDYILNPKNREVIDSIRKKGQELVKEKYTSDYRKECLIKILNNEFELKKRVNEKYKTNYYLGF